jgi:phage gpG-like protein
MIQIDIDDREARRALEELRRRASNMTQAMHAIGQGLAEGCRERILDGRDWTGQPYAPNSPATLARKKGEKPLIDSKSFVRSRLHYQADADSVEVGSSAVQAAVLQFGARRGQFGSTRRGGKIPWGDIPARRYLPVTQDGQLDETARSLILDALRAYLDDTVGG